jgi:RNA polymerase sigma-70 factor (ECF subfamily)
VEFYPFDDAYVARLCAGDRPTQEHFTRYFSELLRIKLRGKLRTVQELEDLSQDVFMRALKALCPPPGGLRDGRKLGAFVNGICNNVYRESWRAGGRTEALGVEHDEVPDRTDGIEQMLLDSEQRAAVRATLATLPTRDRELLQALFFDDRDKDDLCRDFGVDRGYLRVLLHRALLRFRNAYSAPPDAPASPPRETDSQPSSLQD